MNLVKIILDLIFSGDVLGKLSSFLGTDDRTAKTAASAAVPAILSGLAGMASSDDGARKLSSTLGNLDSSLLGNLSSLLSGEPASFAQKGASALSSLLGDGVVSNIASAVGKYSGLDALAGKKLMSFLGPAVLGMVASQWKKQGGGLGALTSLLAGQQKNLAAALPSGFSLADIPGLPTAEATLRAVGQNARSAGSAASYAAHRTADVAADATSSMVKWIAPLACLLLAALGLWYFFGRGNAQPNVAQNKAPQNVAPQTTAPVTTLRPTLPDMPAIPDVSAITKDLTGIFTSAKDTLGSIRDAASARNALPKLGELSTKIDGIRDYLDKLPATGQVAVGQLVDKQFAPLQEQASKILAIPGLDEQTRSILDGITGKLAGLNLAQVSQDATDIFATLTKTLSGLKDTASAEAALPGLQDVSGKIDDLKRVQTHMSPGGQSLIAKIVSAARGSLDQLITKVLTAVGADVAAIKPVLDEIVNKLDWFTQQSRQT